MIDGRTLSDVDIQAIGEAVATRLPVCSLGLDSDDAAIIKNHLRLWKQATSIIGSVILTAIAVLFVGIFTKGFWMSLIEGVKR
jgi:hypothetical protein